jgi:AMMECR1 domain-containing protein
MVRRGAKVGVLLPQVAAEHGWGPEAFLAAACHKAGLAPEAWQEGTTEVFTFQADVFGESSPERQATREGEG